MICGHGDLLVLDTDLDETSNIGLNVLPPTFTIKTTGGYHFYFLSRICTTLDQKLFNLNKDGKHYGEIRCQGIYVVGPNCIHPSGRTYSIERDLPIHRFD